LTSSEGATGVETRYRPASQLSRSINLQRSLQKGRKGLPSKTVSRLQIGQRMMTSCSGPPEVSSQAPPGSARSLDEMPSRLFLQQVQKFVS